MAGPDRNRRAEILSKMMELGEQGKYTMGELARELDMPLNNLSPTLRRMERDGLITLPHWEGKLSVLAKGRKLVER